MNLEMEEEVRNAIRDVPDFPKKGILFKDIMPIFENPALCRKITMKIVEQFANQKLDAIVGIESRGFFWGLLLAQELKIPFIAVRKKGKLPYKTVSFKYDLEYGSSEIEMHEGVISDSQKVLIHDDLLATGGTAAAAAELVKSQGAEVVGFSFLVILEFLKGEDCIKPYSKNIKTIVRY